jgi:hypothetical protein
VPPSSFASVSIRFTMFAASSLASFSMPRISSRLASSIVSPEICSSLWRCSSISASSFSCARSSCFSRVSERCRQLVELAVATVELRRLPVERSLPSAGFAARRLELVVSLADSLSNSA